MAAQTGGRQGAAESALIVVSRSAEAIINRWRTRLDPSAAAGIPAHVTVLYPFRAPAEISAGDKDELRHIFQGIDPVEFRLAGVDWFDRRVLYITLDPADPFRAMTRSVATAFPDCPPYRNAFESIVPHVTVAEGAPLWRMRRVAKRVARSLPTTDVASEVLLMAPEGSRWEVADRFQLGTAPT